MADAFEGLVVEAYDHPYTPKHYIEMSNTLSCHQMGGLQVANNHHIRPADMGQFQAEHLLEAGYIVIYFPECAKKILDDARNQGDIDG